MDGERGDIVRVLHGVLPAGIDLLGILVPVAGGSRLPGGDLAPQGDFLGGGYLCILQGGTDLGFGAHWNIFSNKYSSL